MRLSTHNRLGVRLADTFLLALLVNPDVLLGEIVGTMVNTTALAMCYTLPATQQISPVALARFHTGQGAIMRGLWVSTGSRAGRATDLIVAVIGTCHSYERRTYCKHFFFKQCCYHLKKKKKLTHSTLQWFSNFGL